MIVFFTLCSANYLAQAKTLGETLVEHNPDVHFVIGLVDRIEGRVSQEYWKPFELVPVDVLGVEGFDELCRKYDVVELNTALKPFYMEYLYKRDAGVDAVIYLDPDIMVLGSFDRLVLSLQDYNIVLSPHSYTASFSPQAEPYEIAMLRTGMYNLGFIATRRNDETLRMLKWWQSRLQKYGYNRAGAGLFVDQIWANFMPLYFDQVLVDKYPGYNMCYWNHFERQVSLVDGKHMVNSVHELVFYHFSSYNPATPENLSNRATSHSLSDRPDLGDIFARYTELLTGNDYWELIKLKPYYSRFHRVKFRIRMYKAALSFYRKYLG
jgi:hypothetical protein